MIDREKAARECSVREIEQICWRDKTYKKSPTSHGGRKCFNNVGNEKGFGHSDIFEQHCFIVKLISNQKFSSLYQIDIYLSQLSTCLD